LKRVLMMASFDSQSSMLHFKSSSMMALKSEKNVNFLLNASRVVVEDFYHWQTSDAIRSNPSVH
jgi:hypothetical protein